MIQIPTTHKSFLDSDFFPKLGLSWPVPKLHSLKVEFTGQLRVFCPVETMNWLVTSTRASPVSASLLNRSNRMEPKTINSDECSALPSPVGQGKGT